MTTCFTLFSVAASKVSLSDALQFITGSQKLPATGLEAPIMVTFTSVDQLPTAHTCSCSLTFSRCWGDLTPGGFGERMEMCILNSTGFQSI